MRLQWFSFGSSKFVTKYASSANFYLKIFILMDDGDKFLRER